jgi:membrane associated rhomboid family serine protease
LLGGGSRESGIAYAAHIGGFIAGAVLAKPFMFGRPGRGAQIRVPDPSYNKPPPRDYDRRWP